MISLCKYALLAIAFIGVGMLINSVLADHTGGSGEVRVIVQRHDDGRIEVGLQERETGGGWGERQLPAARFLSEHAPSSRWIASSPLDVGAGHYLDRALVCLVDHATPNDTAFWSQARRATGTVQEHFKMNLRVSSGATPSAQAALIEECAEDEAVVIATTLAAPDALAESLQTARATGSQLVSFNSGGDAAASVGSAMHIGLDDAAGGAIAGQAFTDAGVSGTVLCVIHEEVNVGLEQRCEAAETTYSGTVERLRVHEAGLADLSAVEATIAQRLAEGGVGGVLTLNAGMVDAASAAIRASGERIALGTFGWSPASVPRTLSGEILFSVYDQPALQANLTVAASAIAGFIGSLGGDPGLLFGGAKILIEPLLFDRARSLQIAETLAALQDSDQRPGN